MAHTIRSNRNDRPERRRRRIESDARLQRLARRDSYRESRQSAAPQPLWVVYGDWGEGFIVRPLRPGCCVSAGESLISDPTDTSHLWEAVIHWQI